MPDALLVVNASPLIFLANAGHIELLHTLGASRIIVPEPVCDEVMSGGYTDKAARAISDATWLEKRPSPSIPESVVAWEIGKGESSVIATALHEPGARVVIDDLNGRKCALAHELDVVGTLGVVIAAHRQGRDDPRAVLLELRTAGMWLSDAVIARVLRIAGIN
jgi:predicted nucleic acid-binding protein